MRYAGSSVYTMSCKNGERKMLERSCGYSVQIRVFAGFALVAFLSLFCIQPAFADYLEGPIGANIEAYEHVSDGEIYDGSDADALIAQSEDEALSAQASGVTNIAELSITLAQMIQIQVDSAGYSNTTALRTALDPNQCSLTQFVDLTSKSGLTAAQIDAYIDSTPSGRSGTLHGMGDAFIKAEQAYNVNAAYLVAHAILESGWGTSTLAQGFSYGGSTYYNFYGIGAVDYAALSGGQAAAVKNGWNSREKAIVGAAQWINTWYIRASSNAQSTLYAMKWSYAEASSEGTAEHEYATDISWPESIARIMDEAYSTIGVGTSYSYIVPHYIGSSVPDTTARNMYRLYNPNSGEHFYTADVAEKTMLVGLGWNDEGVGWTAPVSSSTPVYRLYNPNAGEYHYTTGADERDMLVDAGWNYESIGWYSDDAQSVPLYRQYNPNAFSCNHNYTKDSAERDYLISIGWNDESVGWYGI